MSHMLFFPRSHVYNPSLLYYINAVLFFTSSFVICISHCCLLSSLSLPRLHLSSPSSPPIVVYICYRLRHCCRLNCHRWLSSSSCCLHCCLPSLSTSIIAIVYALVIVSIVVIISIVVFHQCLKPLSSPLLLLLSPFSPPLVVSCCPSVHSLFP